MDLRGAKPVPPPIMIMGLSFKENCPDLRNTKVVDIIAEFKDYGLEVEVYDPWVEPLDALNEYGLEMLNSPKKQSYDAVVLAVGHQDFSSMPVQQIKEFTKPRSVIFDVKNVLPPSMVDGSL